MQLPAAKVQQQPWRRCIDETIQGGLNAVLADVGLAKATQTNAANTSQFVAMGTHVRCSRDRFRADNGE